MTWLYGDSSTSPLEVNFIDFLRLSMDFAVEVLLAEDRISDGRERRYRLEGDADGELDRLDKLGTQVAKAIEAQATGSSSTARCAAAIGQAATDAVKAESAAVKGKLEGEVAKLEGDAAKERERCVKALEALLLRYDLPDTRTTLVLEPATPAPYAARLRGVTGYGLETLLELEIPAANVFAHDVRVDRFMEGLEVKVPEAGGFLRKPGRIAPHRLGKYRIARLSAAGGDVRVELRASADPHATGFHVTVNGDKTPVRLAPIGKDEEVSSTPFEPDDADAAKLRQLSERLTGAVTELGRTRKTLLEARLDGEPLSGHAHPSALVERLIAVMSPTVRAISQHSSSPGELVLRRLLGGDRREEIFVSKGELGQKLDPLPVPRRALFDPLGLMEGIPAAAPAAARAGTEPVDMGMVIEEKGPEKRV